MKLFLKILLFVFVALIANVNATNASITFPNIQETTISFSFQNETPKTICKFIENDLANRCQNTTDLVDYRNRSIGVEVNAAKGGSTGFEALVQQLPKAGQQNVRILQSWAKSKGFVKGPNTAGPQIWGVYDNVGNFS